MAPLFRGPISGRFSRAFARSGGHRLNRSSKTLNDEAAFSVCGCHHRMTEIRSRGRRLRHDIGRESPIVGELPSTLELVLGNQLYIAKEGLHPGLRNRLLRLAAFQNPEFYKAQAMRLSTYNKPRVVACAEDLPHHIGLPRGCLDDVRKTARRAWRRHGHSRRTPRRQFSGGDVSGRAAAGTEDRCGRHACAMRQASWRRPPHSARPSSPRGSSRNAASTRSCWSIGGSCSISGSSAFRPSSIYPTKSIGRIGGGRSRPTGRVDVGIIQSLVRKGVVSDIVADYGHVIIDECHHLSAHSFEQVARQAKARFVLGLSATVARKDGHHPIIFMQCGPVRHQVNARAQAASRPFEHFVLVQPTPFQPNRNPDPDKRVEFHVLYQELIDDQARTRRICEDVIDSVRNGRSPLILTERNDHLDRFEKELATRVDHVVVLRAGVGKKQRRAINDRLAAIPRHEGRVIIATGKYVGEGFDDPRLDTLFLTLPVSWRGTVAQYAGRLHRLYDGKREVRIYDYADLNVPMLARMFDRRCRGYEAIGYTILLPASAIPGWPADVVLPSDPVWKRDYSGSVRRLVRDGVDMPLASLFVHAARAMPEDAEGAARARSATEAFLYRRLDTLAETNGRFRLNVALPIPFDGFGTLEVDLLCADARVAIELDGGQHLADPVAYRRDRRKDQLLQENGYFVLRFLAEDVGKELDAVLDAILRVLARRRHSATRAEPLRFVRRGGD